ncbi:Tfp pilus assembly protein FimT/FimU [Pontiella sp.]|uniref:pilus assembly FimT family protein n=1 Tax=Pontiella sp. TaxID=2837462 RepID=UPI0035680CCA
MKKPDPSKIGIPGATFGNRTPATATRREAFTLIEVVMVMVLIVIITGISMPYLGGTLKGSKLKTSARAVRRITRYARSMAIMREETMTVALNRDTFELFMGGTRAAQTGGADGELDQDVLKRLGYVDGEGSSSSTGTIDKEVHVFLPDGLTIKDFDKNRTTEDDEYEHLLLIRFYPNGQCEWFKLELEDTKGSGVLLEIDPISGKMTSEFTQ